MRKIQRKKKFLNDLARSGRPDFIDEIDSILYFLQRDGELHESYDAHPLFWQWAGFWDVHLDDDWILVYRITAKKIRLIRLVRHQQLRESKP